MLVTLDLVVAAYRAHDDQRRNDGHDTPDEDGILTHHCADDLPHGVAAGTTLGILSIRHIIRGIGGLGIPPTRIGRLLP